MSGNPRYWGDAFISPSGRIEEATPSPSEAGALLHNMNRMDLAEPDNPHNAEWHELFRAMGRFCVGMAFQIEAYRGPDAKKSGASAALRDQLAEYATTGMEAVTIGEALLHADRDFELRPNARFWRRVQPVIRADHGTTSYPVVRPPDGFH